MNDTIITVDNLSKRYRLGQIGATTLRESVDRWWGRLRGRPPMAAIHNLDPKRHTPVASHSSANEFWALRDVSFEVKRGEVLGIIGRNGAGKSTLLKILSRITEPTSGKAILRGRVASLLEVGTGFHPELSGRENVFLNGVILGMRRAEISSKFDEIVAFSELDKFIDTPVKRYSSGMYVRLAFAVAAHLDPEILLVDEVLAVGDVAFQKKCLGKMGEVIQQGRTVLFVSHNMAAINELCARCIVLNSGKNEFIGDTAHAINQYYEDTLQFPVSVETENVIRPDFISEKTVLRFVRLELLSSEKKASVKEGEPLKLRCYFEVYAEARNVVFGLSIQYGNIQLIGGRSLNDIGMSKSISKGQYYINITLNDHPLKAGIYTIAIEARTAERSLDYLPNIMLLKITEKNSSQTPWIEQSEGKIKVDMKWEMHTYRDFYPHNTL